jgi:nucleoside-diphosphate-sugar epimerase
VTFLVTGGTGFIGRRLVDHLLDRYGAGAVTCLVKPSTKPAEAAAVARYERLGVTLLRGDLLDTPVCAVPPPRVDVVFHLAANIDTDTPESEHRVNDRGTANLLDWLAPILPGCRVMYTSSVAVIDRTGPADGPMREDTVCTPRTPYGVTKLRGEEVLRQRAAAAGYTWTILRLPTVYGPGQKAGGLFDLLIEAARHGGLVGRINWPGRTSILYLDDAAAMLHALALRADAAGELFMVSSGEDCTLADIAAAAGDVVGRPPRPIRLPRAAWTAIRTIVWSRLVARAVPRAAQVTYWRLSLIVDDGFWCDSSKLRAIYREPVVPLGEGVRRTIGGAAPGPPTPRA